MAKKRRVVRVVPDGKGGWNVTDNNKPVSNHRKKPPVVKKGKTIAKKHKPSQIVIHRKDGTFQTEHTYKDDPYLPEG